MTLTNEELERLLKGMDGETLAISVNKDRPNDAFLHITHDAPEISVRALIHEVQSLRAENERLEVKCETYKTLSDIHPDKRNRMLQSELAALRRFRDGARAVIEFYAQGAKGDDLEVIPEKQEIWALPEKWAQRSMSDHWSGKRAREFISSEVWKGSE